MRAFIKNNFRTSFMQACDVFEKHKVMYEDLDLTYQVNGATVTDEDSVAYLAKAEFKDNLICLFGSNKPFYINPEVQTLSNGKQWFLLYDFVKSKYPSLKLKSDDRYMNIVIDE